MQRPLALALALAALPLTVCLLAAGPGCGTLPNSRRVVLTGADPFKAARRFILRSHSDPRLERVRRGLEQNGVKLIVRMRVPHGVGQDVVELGFAPDSVGTKIDIVHWHIDPLGRRSVCSYVRSLEATVAELLTTVDPEIDARLGTMAISSHPAP